MWTVSCGEQPDPAPYSQTVGSHSVSGADCGEGLQSGFLPLPRWRLHRSEPLNYKFSERPWLLTTPPPHFSKWMIKSKLSGLFHANLKENLGKRFQSCFSCPQFSANDRFRSYCLFFAFRRPGKGLRRNPAHHLFPLQSRTQGSSGRHAQLLTS